ncbi:unnamed protein product [Clonostachys rhizophaga]|uniref:Uncharacterized protein n=1 Tax=Clonostachys rhizophaga TaxID=160324 RepID=A0A9N9VQQ7_9HYPO|nr:unnamed protein product [Clonostachys rhizophaga]
MSKTSIRSGLQLTTHLIARGVEPDDAFELVARDTQAELEERNEEDELEARNLLEELDQLGILVRQPKKESGPKPKLIPKTTSTKKPRSEPTGRAYIDRRRHLFDELDERDMYEEDGYLSILS